MYIICLRRPHLPAHTIEYASYVYVLSCGCVRLFNSKFTDWMAMTHANENIYLPYAKCRIYIRIHILYCIASQYIPFPIYTYRTFLLINKWLYWSDCVFVIYIRHNTNMYIQFVHKLIIIKMLRLFVCSTWQHTQHNFIPKQIGPAVLMNIYLVHSRCTGRFLYLGFPILVILLLIYFCEQKFENT